MAVELFVKAEYPRGADALFETATHFSDLIRTMGRLARYGTLPEVRMEEGRLYRTELAILGIVACPDFTIQIDKLCPDRRVLASRGRCRSVPVWQHHLQISADGSSAVWIDRVVIDAGALTPVISSIAKSMYLHRHKKRGALVASASIGRSYRMITDGVPIFQAAC